MSTKHDSKCLNNARDDEPIFVLRSSDISAPDLVREWASRLEKIADFRRSDGPELTEKRFKKAADARKVAAEMEAYAAKNFANGTHMISGKVPD